MPDNTDYEWLRIAYVSKQPRDPDGEWQKIVNKLNKEIDDYSEFHRLAQWGK